MTWSIVLHRSPSYDGKTMKPFCVRLVALALLASGCSASNGGGPGPAPTYNIGVSIDNQTHDVFLMNLSMTDPSLGAQNIGCTSTVVAGSLGGCSWRSAPGGGDSIRFSLILQVESKYVHYFDGDTAGMTIVCNYCPSVDSVRNHQTALPYQIVLYSKWKKITTKPDQTLFFVVREVIVPPLPPFPNPIPDSTEHFVSWTPKDSLTWQP